MLLKIFKKITLLWQFSRPHTIIGSIISITVLWLLTFREVSYTPYYTTLWITLLVGLTCNIFIVGLNQIIDIDLDKINKPNLPLANQSISLVQAKIIITICFIISIGLAIYEGPILATLITLIMAIGIAYSVPPIQLKKHHLPAALSITTVRGILVNVGMFLHFQSNLDDQVISHFMRSPWVYLPMPIWVLTGFVVAFSIAIAWYKDLADVKGDAEFKFKTLPILYSPKLALKLGGVLVALAYLAAIYWSFSEGIWFLFYVHLIAIILFVLNIYKVDLENPKSIYRFYMLFWIFFFAEYLFFGVWSIIN